MFIFPTTKDIHNRKNDLCVTVANENDGSQRNDVFVDVDRRELSSSQVQL